MIRLFLAFSTVAMAAEQLVYPLPQESSVAVQRDVVYDATRKLKMDVYRPANAAGPIPAVVFINVGGNYRGFAQYTGWGRLVTGSGLAGVVYDAHEDSSAEDARAVLRYLQEHGAELHVDGSRIVIWSCSANVKVGLPLAMDRANTAIQAAVIYYGTAEVKDLRLDLPILLVRAGLDGSGLKKGMDGLVTWASAANAPVSLINVAAAHHGFDLRDDNEASRTAIARTLEFMKTELQAANRQAIAAGVDEAAAAGAVFRNDTAAALRAYESLATKKSADPEIHRNYGNALFQNGDYRKALTEYQRALDLGNPNVGWISYSAAVASLKLGDTDGALGFVEKLKNIPPMWRQLNNDPSMAPLKGNPRFKAVADQ